jgi:putative heme iron utilization protein
MLHNDPWKLIDSLQSMIVSSVDTRGLPHISYAPFIQKEQIFYICISAMSSHTQNLLHTPVASIAFIEDESKSNNIFARRRVTFTVNLRPVERGSIEYNGAMTLFEDRFGELASIYKTMPDFQLFALNPVSGRAVFGFGQAYDFKDGRFDNISIKS